MQQGICKEQNKVESVTDRPYAAQCSREYVKNKVESVTDRPYAAQCSRDYIKNKGVIIGRPYAAQCSRDYVKNKGIIIGSPNAGRCCRDYVKNKNELSHWYTAYCSVLQGLCNEQNKVESVTDRPYAAR